MPMIVLGQTLYSLKEAAEMLNVSPRSVYTYIKNGKIKAQKIGAGWRFTEDTIKEFINASHINETPPPERARLSRQKINEMIAEHERANIQKDNETMKRLENELRTHNARSLCEFIIAGDYTRARDAARRF